MNPVSRRRVARRRLIAEWAARANRLFGGEAVAVRADASPDRELTGMAQANEPPARRLPFELLEAPPVALADPPPSNGKERLESPQGTGGTEGASMAELPTASLAGVESGAHAAPAEQPPAADSTPAEAGSPVETDSEEHLYQAARHAADQRDRVRAVKLYRQLLEKDPANLRARNNLALVLDQWGEHEEALEHLDRCRRQDPLSVEVLINRSAVLGALGRYVEAERDLLAVLDREPANAEAHFNLGVVTSRRGRWHDGVTHLRRAVELDGGQAAAYFYLGEALNHVDDLPGALQAYQRSVELKPSNPKALYGMGIVLDRMNRPDDAAPLYRRSRELTGK